MPPDGQIDLALSYSSERFSTYYGPDGPEEVDQRFQAYQLFAEYGVSDAMSLVLTLPYVRSGPLTQGWQDGSLWLKYRNERRETVQGFSNWLTAVGLTLPLSRYAVDIDNAIGQRAAVFHGRVVWQYEAGGGWFFHVQSGIDFQVTPTARGAWPLLLRTGYGARYFYLEGWGEIYRSLETTAPDNFAAGTGSSWTRVGGTLYVPIGSAVGVVAGGAFILSGENIGRSARWNLGVVVRILPKRRDNF